MSVAERLETTPRHEPMRIAGRLVDSDRRLKVLNPYDGGVVGTVAMADVGQVREAFDIAAAYTPTLSRYDRQKILFRTAEILEARRDGISDLITAECGISKKDSLYEVGRAYDVFTLSAQLCLVDD
ncbi:MAG: aldehyde dehydrogenase family protein, partial [Alphaproteobacteria bacterium]|nr:aldehyde dehydrogenase family protein [Alphaproteobacteria bacterium]